MSRLVRAATLTNFEQICSECGLDAGRLLVEVGLPNHCLSEPDLMIPASAVAQLLELASARGREPAFGVRMAASRRLSNLGALGLLLRDQPTLRHALEQMVAHVHRHAEAITLSLVESGELVSIRLEARFESGLSTRQATEMSMVTAFRTMSIFLGDGWQPRLVTFRYAAPPSSLWHRRVFGNALAFGHEFNDIMCSARDLQAPNPGADPVMARYAQKLLGKEPAADAMMSERVRRLVILLLPRGHCRADVVAQHLGVDRRTVTNHLAREGSSFKQLVDGMRKELLASYVQESAHSFSEVAALLGFSELSAFSRWHKSHFGVTASQRWTA